MARLVVLSEGYTGRTYELKVERTTIGRHEDNAFQIPDGSVSGHHGEVIQRGNDIVIVDLGSTNGTFINGEQITEAVLKPGQTVRFGSIDVRLEVSPPPGPSGKKQIDKTQIIPQGVKMGELDSGTKTVTFDKASVFKKKSNKTAIIFIVIGVILGLVIVGAIVFMFIGLKGRSGS